MLDIKFIRENSNLVKENIKKKFQNDKIKLVDEGIEKDKKYRDLLQQVENLRHKRNIVTKEINDLKSCVYLPTFCF